MRPAWSERGREGIKGKDSLVLITGTNLAFSAPSFSPTHPRGRAGRWARNGRSQLAGISDLGEYGRK